MIDYISGKLAEVTPTYVVIDCGGVGYGLCVSLTTYSAINGQNSAKLLVYEAIREDAYVLYGFATAAERDMFKMLISVSGVGANTARIILSAYPIAELQRAIASEDVKMISSVKGIGAKTAQRLIVELKEKVMKLGVDLGENISAAVDNKIREDALEALEVLGFNKQAAAKMVDKLLKENPQMAVEVVVKTAIKLL